MLSVKKVSNLIFRRLAVSSENRRQQRYNQPRKIIKRETAWCYCDFHVNQPAQAP